MARTMGRSPATGCCSPAASTKHNRFLNSSRRPVVQGVRQCNASHPLKATLQRIANARQPCMQRMNALLRSRHGPTLRHPDSVPAFPIAKPKAPHPVVPAMQEVAQALLTTQIQSQCSTHLRGAHTQPLIHPASPHKTRTTINVPLTPCPASHAMPLSPSHHHKPRHCCPSCKFCTTCSQVHLLPRARATKAIAAVTHHTRYA